MTQDKEIQRLQNQINALAFTLKRVLTIACQTSNNPGITARLEAEILALNSLLAQSTKRP